MRSLAMVGHAEERGELRHAWARVVADATSSVGSRTALITGPAGIGKSRIVTATLDTLTPRPASIHVGTARVHSPAPYDWLAALLSHHDHLDVAVPAVALAWLRQDPDVPIDRYAPEALLRIAVRIVRALVGRGPAVLVVEDLHALDPASLNLVAELAVAPALPAFLLVTSRPTESALHVTTLARLAGAPGAIRAHLGPLDRAGIAAALADAYRQSPDRVIDAVLARTGGDPAQLSQLLADAEADSGAWGNGGTGGDGDTGGDPAASADLTARERDVLGWLAEGMSNQQIATRLGISVRTVAVHVSNVLRKTHSRSRTDAALWAVRRRLGRSTSH